MSPEERIKNALAVAFSCSQIDGEHHKEWAIDQMVRCLTGCPTIQKTGVNVVGEEFEYDALGESEEYKEFIEHYMFDELGLDDDEKDKRLESGDYWDWSEGIAP